MTPQPPPSRILKRSGETALFDIARIQTALRRAGQATQQFGDVEASVLAERVLTLIPAGPGITPNVEQVQDIVEQTLIAAGHLDTARAYIAYRSSRARARQDHKTLVDVGASINEYLDRSDWRVSANANQGYSLGGLILNLSGKVVANYWLSHLYPPEVGEAHREGDIHIHDLDVLAGYCAGWSLRNLLTEGLNGIPGKVERGRRSICPRPWGRW